MAATPTDAAPAATATTRLLSLDIARGIIIAFMIMVNDNGEHPYHPFTHSAWSGWTPTDLVFPCFIFIVGMCARFGFRWMCARITFDVGGAVVLAMRGSRRLPRALGHQGLVALSLRSRRASA